MNQEDIDHIQGQDQWERYNSEQAEIALAEDSWMLEKLLRTSKVR